jgi:hypothetical protein
VEPEKARAGGADFLKEAGIFRQRRAQLAGFEFFANRSVKAGCARIP